MNPIIMDNTEKLQIIDNKEYNNIFSILDKLVSEHILPLFNIGLFITSFGIVFLYNFLIHHPNLQKNILLLFQ